MTSATRRRAAGFVNFSLLAVTAAANIVGRFRACGFAPSMLSPMLASAAAASSTSSRARFFRSPSAPFLARLSLPRHSNDAFALRPFHSSAPCAGQSDTSAWSASYFHGVWNFGDGASSTIASARFLRSSFFHAACALRSRALSQAGGGSSSFLLEYTSS